MGFGDLRSAAGLGALDGFLLSRSYIEGYQPSQADVVVFQCVGERPSDKFENVLRWYKHIESFGDERKAFPGEIKPADQYGTSEKAPAKTAAAVADDEDDVGNLFGSDSDDEEAEILRKERQAALEAKKAPKAALVAKSTIVLDVKPWDDETDMAEVEKCVRSITADGLLWGNSKLVPLAYGIKKLQIGCVVEDDKIGTDFLEEEIMKFEDLVQSVDVASFQKL
ncbi:elongation factor 1-beta [Paragonimus westermani]|uniref:Elongation factor 1-beta n=1 Tax=Paragonimus westermani TaxID=34504 RepID=A0A5J4N6H7_9TREM|nr:elongation factor 1-beta [Paragonimus westermani]